MSRRHRLTVCDDRVVVAPPSQPSAPTGLLADPSLNSVALTWNVNPESNIANYKLYRLIFSTWTLIQTVSIPAATVGSLTASTAYSFRVTAVSTVPLESDPSATVTVTTDTAQGTVPQNLFDPTGTTDISDALGTWLNSDVNVPSGGSLTSPTRIKFPALQSNGQPAVYRIEGGINGGMHLRNMSDVIIDGGGLPGGLGIDGAQFVQKTKNPFQATADPSTNPRGSYHSSDGTTTAVAQWSATTTYAVNAIVTPGDGIRYKAKFGGNLNRPPATSPNWWLNVGADGQMTTTTFDVVAAGLQVGDQIELHVNALPSSWVTRNIVNVAPGGDSHALRYSGVSIGAVNSVTYSINPRGKWNVVYTPTNTVKTNYTGVNASDESAITQARNKADDTNRTRSMFIMEKCTRVRIRGAQLTGINNTVYNGSAGFDERVEAQDGIVWSGCVDCELADTTIEKFWGNGLEAVQYLENDNSLTATLGLWVHDSKLQNFGRQSMSLTYGGRYIIEDTYLGESARSLVDSEPTTTRVDASLTTTVQDIHILGCQIGQHGLGMMSLHPGVSRVHVDSCTGRQIGTSGVANVDYAIFENNVENPQQTDATAYYFGSSTHIQVRNNHGQPCSNYGVEFRAGSSNYQVLANDFGLKPNGAVVPQFGDTQSPAWAGTFTPFTLPVPAHALRDLVVTPPTTVPTNVTAVALRGAVAASWVEPTAANSYTHWEFSIYGMVAGTPTVPTAPNSPTSHTATFPQRRLVEVGTTWAAITGASNVDGTGWLNTIFDTSAGGFADSYKVRVRGYDANANTFGTYSAYSNAVTPTESTGQGSFITGAQLPDGTDIGIPAGTVLAAFAPADINHVSGTVTAKKVTSIPTISGVTTFTNCLIQASALVNHLTGTAPGTQIHNPSGFMVNLINCEIDGGGPGGFGSGVDWANFNIQKTIIHGHSSFCAYGGSGCNITVNQSWLWDVCPWGNAQENSAFAHRDCIPFFGDSAGPSVITNNVLELHSDQNAVLFAQSSQGAITRTHTWSHNWVDGGGGRMLYVDGPPHNGAFACSGTFNMADNRFMRHPYGYWSNGSFAGTSGNPVCVQNDASAATISFGSPDTNRWWEPLFAKPIGV